MIPQQQQIIVVDAISPFQEQWTCTGLSTCD